MILQKTIPHPHITHDYKEFVESFKNQLLKAFGDKIHSLYICGSIPKGTAKPYKSDADFTILCENSGDIDRVQLAHLKEKHLEQFPFVTKIDTTICTLDDVRNMPNEWGFWIKIICVNIHGDDFGEAVPPIVISRQFILDLNSDTQQEVSRVNHALIHATDSKAKCRYIKGYSKRLLRALYSLVLEDVGVWQDDMAEIKKSIISFSEFDPALVEYLYTCYLHSDVDVKAFKEKADEVYSYFERCLSALSASNEVEPLKRPLASV